MGEVEAKACGVVVGEYGNVADVVFVAAFACGHFDFVQFVDVVGGDGFAIDHAGLFNIIKSSNQRLLRPRFSV